MPGIGEQQDRIAVILAGFSSNLELEIQQRSVEFGSLFSKNEIKSGVLERMPPPEIRATMMGTGELPTAPPEKEPADDDSERA